MAADPEYRFRIDAYSPETIPMARLAEYLRELAAVLGEAKAVHFVRLDSGSTVVVHKVEAEAVPKVAARARAVARGHASRDAMRAYETINRLLRADNGKGVLQENSGAEIIIFPGIEEVTRFGSVTQQCSVDGEAIRIGGTGERVPITLRSEDELISNCYATRAVAKQLAAHLFEPVRLFGTGRFIREDRGTWKLDYFALDRFEILSDEPLSGVVLALRAITGGEWGDDPLAELNVIRNGPKDAQNGGV